jgi:hypothetical protein
MILPLFHHFAFFSENYKHKPKGFLLLKQPHAATEVPFIPFMRYIRPDLNKMMNIVSKIGWLYCNVVVSGPSPLPPLPLIQVRQYL